MAEHPPFGDIEDESTVPIWTIEPAAGDKDCPQMEDFVNFARFLDPDPRFKDGAWDSVNFDHTLSEDPFSALWHVHFIFDRAPDEKTPYTQSDLVNSVGTDDLTDGGTIRTAVSNGSVFEVSIPFGFNCPIRPADEDHENYCD